MPLKIETEAECRERCERVHREIVDFDKRWRAEQRAKRAASESREGKAKY